MGSYSLDSRLGELLENPLAADIIERFTQEKGIPKTLLTRGKLQKLTLQQLSRLTISLYDDDRLEQYIDDINAYDEQILQESESQPIPHWWKEAVFYRMHCKTAEDLAQKLPRLNLLSVDIIWLTAVPGEYSELNAMLQMLHDNDKKLIVTVNSIEQAEVLLKGGVNGIAFAVEEDAKLHQTLRGYNSDCFSNYNNIVTLGYLPSIGHERTKLITCENRGELNLVYGDIGNPEKTFSLDRLKQYLIRHQQLPGSCWGAISFDDGVRMLHRLQPRWLYKDRVAELLAVLLTTLKGSPILRQGQEYGLSGELQNPKNDDSKNDIFDCYSRLIALRKEHKALVYGQFLPVFTRDKNYFCYFRKYKGERYYIECNLTERTISRRGELAKILPLYCSYGDFTSMLRPYEANIYKVTE